jgi:Ca2+-binding RTX toxin-like protein
MPPTIISYGNGNDNTSGTILEDIMYGNGGNDTLFGLNGGDYIYGGNEDTAFSASVFDGNDILNGDQGNDYIYGGSGNDQLFGGADNDALVGAYGDDLLVGGSGNDTLYAMWGSDTLNGAGRMRSNAGTFEISTGRGEVDNLYGAHSDAGTDTFVLGHRLQAGVSIAVPFYDDGNASTAGLNDYAIIHRFNKNLDTIELAGSKSNYILKDSPISLGQSGTPNTAVFYKGANGAVHELIAVITNVAKADLSLNANYFKSI